jgi:protein-disulfide isomerase
MLTRHLIATVSFMCLLPFAAIAENASAPAISTPSDNSPVTHAEINELIKKAILDNPELIIQSVQQAQAKEAREGEKRAKEALQKHKEELVNDTSSPSIGPKNADVTIIEFFDYHCGYCKHLLPTISKLTNEDKNVRVIFKEYPILTEDSITAARAALAVNHIAPNKYFEFHSALMKSNGTFDEKMLLDTAKGLGINTAKLKEEMEKPEITVDLTKDHKLAKELNVQGTPALVIGNQLYPGAIPYDQLKKLIADARSGKTPDADTTAVE